MRAQRRSSSTGFGFTWSRRKRPEAPRAASIPASLSTTPPPTAIGSARAPLAAAGVTLIELVTGLAVLGILTMLALPNFATWIQNSQVRTAGESILNGLQLARIEALRRNAQVRFRLTSTTTAGLANWSIDADDPAVAGIAYNVAVQTSNAESTPNARVGAGTGVAYGTAIDSGANLPAEVIFNSLGRVVQALGAPARIDVTNAQLSAADTRRLIVLVSAGGLIRMCDPAVASTDARAC